MDIKVKLQLVAVEEVTFGDGTKRPKASVKLDSGQVCDVWGTNDASAALTALKDAPMGTVVDATFSVRPKGNGNTIGLHLLDVQPAAQGRAA